MTTPTVSLEAAIEAEVQRRVAEALGRNSVPKVFTVNEAAEKIRVSRTTVYDMIRAGELTPTANPRKVLIPAAEIERVLSLRESA